MQTHQELVTELRRLSSEELAVLMEEVIIPRQAGELTAPDLSIGPFSDGPGAAFGNRVAIGGRLPLPALVVPQLSSIETPLAIAGELPIGDSLQGIDAAHAVLSKFRDGARMALLITGLAAEDARVRVEVLIDNLRHGRKSLRDLCLTPYVPRVADADADTDISAGRQP